MEIRPPRTSRELAQCVELQAEILRGTTFEESGIPPTFQFAWRNQNLLGCIFWQKTADGGALIVPPVVWADSPQEATRIGRMLLTATVADWHRQRRQFALLFVDANDSFGLRIVSADNTIVPIADILVLEHTLDRQELRKPADANPGNAIPYKAGVRDRFLKTFIASHHESLDCPALKALRTPTQAFATFEQCLESPSALGLLWQAAGEDAGVMFLRQNTIGCCLEISFLGVVPQLRRHGIARTMLKVAFHLSRVRQLSKIQVLVDATNIPARTLYQSAHFVETGRTTLFSIEKSN